MSESQPRYRVVCTLRYARCTEAASGRAVDSPSEMARYITLDEPELHEFCLYLLLQRQANAFFNPPLKSFERHICSSSLFLVYNKVVVGWLPSTAACTYVGMYVCLYGVSL